MQKLLSNFAAGLKNTPQTVAFCPEKTHHNGLVNLLQSSRGAFVSVVSACRVHFLTFFNNYSSSSNNEFARL